MFLLYFWGPLWHCSLYGDWSVWDWGQLYSSIFHGNYSFVLGFQISSRFPLLYKELICIELYKAISWFIKFPHTVFSNLPLRSLRLSEEDFGLLLTYWIFCFMTMCNETVPVNWVAVFSFLSFTIKIFIHHDAGPVHWVEEWTLQRLKVGE